MDDKWEHSQADTIKVSVDRKECISNFGDLPYVVQHELRTLSYPPDPNSVPAGAFGNIHRWVRSDGVTTFIADEHGDKDIYFCDYKSDEKGGAVLANAAIQSASLVKIFVSPQNRHHYEAAHLLISIDEFLQEKSKHLDSGTLTETWRKEGWRPLASYKIAHAVWQKLVDNGFAEPVPKKNGNGPTDHFRFMDRKVSA